jgi:crossover junction endodeoxyribonuclease RuvC
MGTRRGGAWESEGGGMKAIVAIDPGLSGGIAVRWFGKTDCWPMPETQGDLLERLREIKSVAGLEGDELVCVLEEVSGFAGKAQPGSAMFRFGEHFGFIKGVVQALGIRLVLVRPQVWQKGFGLGTASGCASKSEWKNKLKAEAQRRFPHLNVTLKTADALLILEHSISAAGV